MKSNTCPYCGGHYGINIVCDGSERSLYSDKGKCESLIRHERMVREALDHKEKEEVATLSISAVHQGRW